MIEIKNNRYVRVMVVKQQDSDLYQRISDIMSALGLQSANIVDSNYTPQGQEYTDDGLCILGTELTRQQLIAFFDYMNQWGHADSEYSTLTLTYANGYSFNLTKWTLQNYGHDNYSTALLVSIVFNSHADEIQPE